MALNKPIFKFTTFSKKTSPPFGRTSVTNHNIAFWWLCQIYLYIKGKGAGRLRRPAPRVFVSSL